jgi:outer membrane immunogenic protein
MRPVIVALAGAVAVLATSTAFAADMPSKAAPRVVAPAFSWTGLYLGANLGYGWARVNSTNTIAGNGILGAGTSTGSGNLNGINGGGQIGFNYQTGMIVWGIEADFQGSDQKQSSTVSCGAGCSVTGEDRLRSFGTIRGRVGVTAWDRGLLYVTGGWAWMDANSRVNATSGGVTANLIDLSSSKGGWTVGGGAEWMFLPNWSTKLEYLYMRADNVTGTAAIPAGLGGGTLTSSSRVENSVVRVGVNYHFGAPR